ncbi:hypothetical protein TBR22_A41790 [Luteitalea sp. TBR-22]|uniref:DUF4136 domain-containing protein n=1 Tax=Luteitalea sp. TBR-22 TaxID=2802971 RepID=UPI001AF44AE0|nr:DUF4136 domain-containing protein [Luteitalea sp. TBR-22]BCS34953.1 hypothetical protein TBR22_A41790 [Luteitalea sp. TBR-22]
MSMHVIRLLARTFLVGALVLAAAPSSARAQDVGYNFMPGTDFARYKTYRWVTIDGVKYPDDITDAQIRQAIDTQLATKGLTKTDDKDATLYVGYRVALDQEKQLNAYTSGGYGGWGWGGPYRGYGYAGGMTTATTTTITVGTLSVDMYDPTAKQLVWRGTASKTIDTNAKPEKRVKNLNKAMAKMMKNYPPKQK